MSGNSDRIVTDNNDSIFVTKHNDDVWLAIICDATGRAVEIKLDADALSELRDALVSAED